MADSNFISKPIAAAIGVAFVSSLAISSTAIAADNPFVNADLDTGYMLAGDDKGEEGKCGEGKCGADKGAEAAAGDAAGDKGEEGKCGEGKCGADKG